MDMDLRSTRGELELWRPLIFANSIWLSQTRYIHVACWEAFFKYSFLFFLNIFLDMWSMLIHHYWTGLFFLNDQHLSHFICIIFKKKSTLTKASLIFFLFLHFRKTFASVSCLFPSFFYKGMRPDFLFSSFSKTGFGHDLLPP